MTSTSDPAAPAAPAEAPDLQEPGDEHGARAGLCRGRPAAAALPALPRGEGQGRAGADHVRRLLQRRAGQPVRRSARSTSATTGSSPSCRSSPTRIHAHGCALMVQITHAGRRTRWDVGDWLPPGLGLAACASCSTAPSPRSWSSRTSAASTRPTPRRRCGRRRAASTGVELIACSTHLPDQFWSPTDEPPQRRLWRQPREPHPLHARDVRGDPPGGRATTTSSASACRATRCWKAGSRPRRAWRSPSATPSRGLIDYLNVIGADATTDLGISKLIPTMGQRTAPYPRARPRRFKRGDRPAGVPRHPHHRPQHRAARHRRGLCRHGRHDPRPHRRPAHRGQARRAARRTGSAPASAPATASTASMSAATRSASTTRPPAASATMPHVIRPQRRTAAARGGDRRRAGRAGGGAGLGRARARGRAARGHRPAGRAGQPRRPARPAAGDPGHHRLARSARSSSPASTCGSTPTPRPTTCWRWRRTSSSSPPAAPPTPASSASGAGPRRQRLGRAVRADGALGRGAGLRRERPAPGAQRRRVPGPARRSR